MTTSKIPSDTVDLERGQGFLVDFAYPKTGEKPDAAATGSTAKAQIWKDLEDETGYPSYEAYVNQNLQKWPQFKQLIAKLRGLRKYEHQRAAESSQTHPTGEYCLFDAYRTGELHQVEAFQGRFDEDQATGILGHIRNNADEVVSKLIFIEVASDEDLPTCFIDALGLGLGLDPRVFMAFVKRKRVDYLSTVFGDCMSIGRSTFQSRPLTLNYMTEPQPLAPSFVGIGPFVLAYAKNYSRTEGLPPVLLVMGYLNSDQRYDVNLGLELARQPCFTERTDDIAEVSGNWLSLLASLVRESTRATSLTNLDRMQFTICWIVAFWHFQAALLKNYCRRARSQYLLLNLCEDILTVDRPEQDTRAHLLTEWFRLRRSLEDTQDGLTQFKNLILTVLTKRESDNESVQEAYKRAEIVIAEGLRLENEIKDYLQFQVGQLTLEESRKSIDLSNLQIEDAKRVKIVTILAFIYVPLNLATSIFGMNVSQINNSQLDMTASIYTALTLLGVTGACWLATVQHEGYYQWRAKTHGGKKSHLTRHASGYCLLARLTMLLWMLREGEAHWLWSTNAWIGLLTDDLLGSFSYSERGIEFNKACEFVTDRYQNEYRLPLKKAQRFSKPNQ